MRFSMAWRSLSAGHCRCVARHYGDGQVLIGKLSHLPIKGANSDFTSPSSVVVGDVVRLHSTLHCFDPATGDTSKLSHNVPVQLPINPAAAN